MFPVGRIPKLISTTQVMLFSEIPGENKGGGEAKSQKTNAATTTMDQYKHLNFYFCVYLSLKTFCS